MVVEYEQPRSCTAPYDAYVDPRGRLSVPSAGVYKLPLMSGYTVEKDPSDLSERLHWAALYLNVAGVMAILAS